MKRVLIIEAQIKRYRLPFYQKLFATLRNAEIELRVGYSDPSPLEASKNDTCDLPIDYGIKVRGHWLFKNSVLVQPLLRKAMVADLVIIDEGNKFLLNHFLLPLSLMRLRRVAFWGLAENRQNAQVRLSEWYRRKTLNWVSWWFAYTKGSVRYLVRNGVPSWKITAVDNAVDTTEIRRDVGSIFEEDRIALRRHLGIPLTASVGVFCGMLDKVKSVPFLIDSAKMIRLQIPEFHLLLIGTGPDQAAVQTAVEGLSWIHLVGPRFAREKSELIAISDAFLMPGRVGLVILDAFAAGLPLLTTRLTIHGPEIEYLEEGVNGLMSEPNVRAFADMVVSVFSNRALLAQLQAGARKSGTQYTIDNMAANFKAGIQTCLGVSPPQALATHVHAQS